MNAVQESKLNMYRAVQVVCDDNSAIIAANPAFVTAYNSFTANVAALINTAAQESQVISGIAADKSVAKKNICQNGADVAAIVYAYASSIGNNTLKQEVNYAYSDLFRLRDDMVAPTTQNIYNAANANAAALSPFGITPVILTALQSSIDAYSSSVPKPRAAKSNKETYSANIRQLIKAIDVVLKEQLDKLIVTFKTTNPDFASTYKNARTIIDPGHSTTQIKGTVTDESTSLPIVGASIQLEGNPTTVITDTEGNYVLKPVVHGMHSITVSNAGHAPQTIANIIVKLGKAATVDAALKPVA